MQVNQTLAHLAAELAEQREARILAERSAVEWREACEENQKLVEHVNAANQGYAEDFREFKEEIRELHSCLADRMAELEELRAICASERIEIEAAAVDPGGSNGAAMEVVERNNGER